MVTFINRFPEIKRGINNPVMPVAGGEARAYDGAKNKDKKNKERGTGSNDFWNKEQRLLDNLFHR
ncbi:hypothetical protein [Mucilaginibacter sp. RCC_168]|uniref:hypothetical protein n=1 Tax=Mucilaginibacter sp. RCC_168 TaxID=3239221 RepID=UPI0035243BB7